MISSVDIEDSISLTQEITALMKQEGCDIVGFADLCSLPEEARHNFDRGILIALPFSKEAMRENMEDLPQRYVDDHDPMTERLNSLKELVAKYLSDKGYNALTKIPSASPTGNDLRAPLSYKAVATLAGIGWIGKCAMLVTKTFGSAIRLTVVLTNAPLEVGTPITRSLCPPNCTVCVDICPGKAPLGGMWEVGIDRDAFYNAHACRKAARARLKAKLGIEQTVCGLCISHCPFTKRGLGYK